MSWAGEDAMLSSGPGGMLFGRENELSVIRGVLDEAAAGRGSALVIRGVAGIGKTSLLGAARAEAEHRGFTVLSAAGVESESSLPFAVLHQLLGRLLAEATTPPEGRHGMLRAAFGLEEGGPDLYAVALAALELVGEAASAGPIALLIDDLQWLDTASADVLAFVGRRIGGDAVVTLGATRTVDPHDPLRRSGLPELYVTRLGDGDALALLTERAPLLPAALRARVVAEAVGNPLALVELPRAIGQGGWDAHTSMLPLNARLEATFAARFGDLGVRARTLLYVLAADTQCDLRRLLAAATRAAGATVTLQDLQQAIDVDLVEPAGTTPRFRHPLMRSAVYQRATVLERLTAHSALADELRDLPDRRLWHLAFAALGGDEVLADELEGYADRALGRSAGMSAVAALRRAAELTGRPGRRTALLLRAAEVAGELGARQEAERILEATDLTALGPLEQGRLADVLELVRFPRYTDPRQRVRELVHIARRAGEAGGADLMVRLLWRAASRCFLQNVPERERREVADLLDTLGLPEHDPRVIAILSYTVPELRGAQIMAGLSRTPADPSDADALRFLGSAALVMGDFERSCGYLDAATAACRSHGRLGLLARLLSAGNWGNVWICAFDKVRVESEEARSLAEETGEAFSVVVARMNLAAVAAIRGDLDQAETIVRASAQDPLATGMRSILVATTQVQGLVALLRGSAEDAYRTLLRAFDPADPTYHRYMRWWAAPELADAAVAADKVEHAASVLAELDDLAERVTAPMIVVAAHYTRAVLADDDHADEAYRAALASPLAGWPLYRARLQLHQGRRARRGRRLPEARELLRSARDTFDALGAAAWSEMTRVELRAAGENSLRRTANIREQLSAQELQIATLAAAGLTNRQIAQRLFLSHRTVGSHLYRIYPRLGITSRTELPAALDKTVHPDQT